jgi:transcriptional regulator with XRE-family HTH domain
MSNRYTAGTAPHCDQTLAAALRRLRAERGVTQERLALEAGVTIATLSRVERGVADPHWRTIRRILATLGISLTELAKVIESKTPEEASPQLLGNPASVRRFTHRCANERTSLGV